MNLAQQRRVIAVSAMLVFALGFLSNAEKGQLPQARFLIGAGGLFTLVSVFADFGSPIGAGIAIVVLITAVLTEGEGAIKLLSARAGEPTGRRARRVGKPLNQPGKTIAQPGTQIAGQRITQAFGSGALELPVPTKIYPNP
jgi:hypothetical protein